MSLKHILVPLDGSELAEQAINHALNILDEHGELTFLQVVDAQSGLSGYDESRREHIKEEMIESAKAYLDRIGKPCRESGIQTHLIVRAGKPADVIIDVAQQSRVAAIAMSTHGRTGISRWRFGSVTQKVLSATPCPIFIIPQRD